MINLENNCHMFSPFTKLNCVCFPKIQVGYSTRYPATENMPFCWYVCFPSNGWPTVTHIFYLVTSA